MEWRDQAYLIWSWVVGDAHSVPSLRDAHSVPSAASLTTR